MFTDYCFNLSCVQFGIPQEGYACANCGERLTGPRFHTTIEIHHVCGHVVVHSLPVTTDGAAQAVELSGQPCSKCCGDGDDVWHIIVIGGSPEEQAKVDQHQAAFDAATPEQQAHWCD